MKYWKVYRNDSRGLQTQSLGEFPGNTEAEAWDLFEEMYFIPPDKREFYALVLSRPTEGGDLDE